MTELLILASVGINGFAGMARIAEYYNTRQQKHLILALINGLCVALLFWIFIRVIMK